MLSVKATRGANYKRGIHQAAAAFVQRVTDNLLREMSKGSMGRRRPAQDNPDEVGLGSER
jgi:hypothetical protein